MPRSQEKENALFRNWHLPSHYIETDAKEKEKALGIVIFLVTRLDSD